MILLIGDTHLDDSDSNAYRWSIFGTIHRVLTEHPAIGLVVHMGDLVDRKDNHNARFLNRLLEDLLAISRRVPLVILRGNHDTSIAPPHYFEFLNVFEERGPSITYVTQPTFIGDGLLCLPHSPSPIDEWRGYGFADCRGVLMHNSVSGAVMENGIALRVENFPLLPGRLRIYSGHVHVPQTVRNVTYVGTPFPIKFGDNFDCRLVLLDAELGIAKEIPLDAPRKQIATITSLAGLDAISTRPGDMIKLQCALSTGRLDGWHSDQEAIRRWAEGRGVKVAGIEAVLTGAQHSMPVNSAADPEALLKEFAGQEGLAPALVEIGLRLLRDAR